MHILVVWQSFLARFREMKSLILRLFLYSVKVLPANEESQTNRCMHKDNRCELDQKAHPPRCGIQTSPTHHLHPAASLPTNNEARRVLGAEYGGTSFQINHPEPRIWPRVQRTMRIHRRTHNRAVGEYLEWSAHSSGRIQF